MLRATTSHRSPYTAGMLRTGITLIVALTLAGCGMKGDLYLPPEQSAESVTAPVASEAGPADQGERRSIPATPDPAASR